MKRFSLILAILAACPPGAGAQQGSVATAGEAPVVALPGTRQHDLLSEVNGRPYRLSVALPDDYTADGTIRYPVLYLLDSYLTFPAAVSAMAAMSIQNEVEDVIIVGIGAGEPTFDAWFTNRWRDYTPSRDAATDSAGAQAFGLTPEAVRSGGAAAFLRVLREEVIPFVEARYPTSEDRGIAGHSLSGLFAAYALLEAPDVFRRHGLNSPSLWWGNGEMFEREAAFAESRRVLPARVFLSAGSKEGGMVPSMERFAEALRSRGNAGLAVDAVVFQDETHGSVVPAMVARTLRVLYGIPPDP